MKREAVSEWVNRWWNGPRLQFDEIPLEHGERHRWHDDLVRIQISQQIRQLRESRQWSQDALAAAIGTSQSAISKLEDPLQCNPTVNTLIKIAHAFDVAILIRFGEWPVWITQWGVSTVPSGFSSEQAVS